MGPGFVLYCGGDIVRLAFETYGTAERCEFLVKGDDSPRSAIEQINELSGRSPLMRARKML